MTVVWDPDLVGDELLALTRALGERDRDLVILAEGNTSQRLPDGRVLVKASGSSMRTAGAEDFVVVEVDPLVELMRSATATQEDLTAALDAGEHGGRRRQASGSRSPAPSCSPGAWSGPAAPRDRPCTWATGWTTTSGPRPRRAWAPCG
jgi:hypothetical protein